MSSPVAPPAACSSPNYVTPIVRTYVHTCTSWPWCTRFTHTLRRRERERSRRGNAYASNGRELFVLLRTAPSSRRTNKRTDGQTYGASLRSKSTDVGALRRRKPCICRPFKPLSPANVGVAVYLLSVAVYALVLASGSLRRASKAFA